MTLEQFYRIFTRFSTICTDSRSVVPGSIFFALHGDTFDGHDFVRQAIEAGCAYAVVDKAITPTDDKCILVPDTLEFLQKLARYHRKQFSIPIIAITGTNGKTTTKELINAVLSKKFKTHATQGNLNNHIGVPLTLLSLPNDTEIAIIEMGANHKGEIATLCSIVKPKYGIITNIGTAHIEGFGSFEGVVEAKTELYKWIKNHNGQIFLNEDNNLLTAQSANHKPIHRILYGTGINNPCRGVLVAANPYLSLTWKGLEINTHLPGQYNFENVLAAICVGDHYGVNPADIKDAIESYIPTNNRSQIVKTQRNTLILDAYNANPTSMVAAINNFAAMDAHNKTLILGDMLELGSLTQAEHEKIIALLEQHGFKKIFLVGKHFGEVVKSSNLCTDCWFNNVEALIEFIKKNPINQANILIKASRGIKLERVAEFL